jgi:transposase
MSQMAKAAGCSKRTILRISSNMRTFGSAKAPPNKGGRPRSINPVMLEALCDHLLEKPNLYLDEMALFLWDEFDIQATKSSISRALASKRWSKKIAQVKARERNLDLRDEYSHFISDFKSYHLVYVDESGCDKRIGFRRTGWSPLGVTPVQVSKFHRDQRYQILPAYSQDGIVFSRVFQGSTDASMEHRYVRRPV